MVLSDCHFQNNNHVLVDKRLQVTFDELPQKRLFGNLMRPNHSSSPLPPPLVTDPNTEASTSEWSFSHYVPDTDSEQNDDSESDDLDEGDFGHGQAEI